MENLKDPKMNSQDPVLKESLQIFMDGTDG
jgi:hypothetical protein